MRVIFSNLFSFIHLPNFLAQLHNGYGYLENQHKFAVNKKRVICNANKAALVYGSLGLDARPWRMFYKFFTWMFQLFDYLHSVAWFGASHIRSFVFGIFCATSFYKECRCIILFVYALVEIQPRQKLVKFLSNLWLCLIGERRILIYFGIKNVFKQTFGGGNFLIKKYFNQPTLLFDLSPLHIAINNLSIIY